VPSITFTLPVAGQDADAGPIATNFNNLQTLLNGGLDADNLANLAVTDAKLATNISANKIKAIGSFSAYAGVAQTGIVSGTPTKVTFDTEEWDVSGWFAASRFTPLTAGIYRLSALVGLGTAVLDGNRIEVYVYKNGALHRFLNRERVGGATDDDRIGGTALVTANGTTDYFEVFYVHNSGTNEDRAAGSSVTIFQGEFVGTL
jgi:hypothetical protein